MEQTLLLNATYEPLKVVHWQKAMTLWCQGKVEVISVYDREVRSVSFSFKLPSVIRLLRYIKIKRQHRLRAVFASQHLRPRRPFVPVLRAGLSTADLTFDHVVPVAQGGRKDWENIVTCCISCNRRKGGRTPAEARHAPDADARSVPTKRPPSGSRSASRTRPTAGGTTSTGTWSSTRADAVRRPASPSSSIRRLPARSRPIDATYCHAVRITAVRPLWAIEGGRVTVLGERFAIDPVRPRSPSAARPRGSSSLPLVR